MSIGEAVRAVCDRGFRLHAALHDAPLM
jgi:hypothetical protein